MSKITPQTLDQHWSTLVLTRDYIWQKKWRAETGPGKALARKLFDFFLARIAMARNWNDFYLGRIATAIAKKSRLQN